MELQQIIDMIKDTDFVSSIEWRLYEKARIHVDLNWLLKQPFVREVDRQWIIHRTTGGAFISVTTEINDCIVLSILDLNEYQEFSQLISGVAK